MAAVMKLTLRCVFADETTATFTIDNINPSRGVSSDIREKIKKFNQEQGGTLSTKLKSKNGFNWVGIDKAYSTITERTYIF